MTDTTPHPESTQAYRRITRNTVECVPDDEIRRLATEPTHKRAYVGYEPSGVLHLGHMLTANKLMDLQSVGFDIVVLLADVHAYLNGKGSFEEIRDIATRMQNQFIAYGLDPKATEFVLGSEFQLHEEFVLDTLDLALETTLARAERSMAEVGHGDSPPVSQAIYPLMQALDMVYLDVDIAVGGIEQRKIHMLARDVLPKLDTEPPACLHTPLLADLKTGRGKMSASDGLTISLADSRDDLAQKIEAAFCPRSRNPDPAEHTVPPGTDLRNPVLQLFRYHVFPRFEQVTVERPTRFGGDTTYDSFEDLAEALESEALHPEDAKRTLVEYLDRLMEPARNQLAELTNGGGA